MGGELLDGDAVKCSRKKNSDNGFQMSISEGLLTSSLRLGSVREESLDSTYVV